MNTARIEVRKDNLLPVQHFSGFVSGWFAAFTRDKDGDLFKPGSLAKTAREQAGKTPLMVKHNLHGGDVLETIGRVALMHEDELGLAGIGVYDTTELAQIVRQKAVDGTVTHFSVGVVILRYEPVTLEDGSEGRDIHEAAIKDVVLTNFPRNPDARITEAKSQPPQPPPPPHADEAAAARHGAADAARTLALRRVRIQILSLETEHQQ